MQKLIKLRKRMGVSQDKMAELLGYGSGIRISEIESGKVKMSKPAQKCLEYLEMLHSKLDINVVYDISNKAEKMAMLIRLCKEIVIPVPNQDGSVVLENIDKNNPVAINGKCFQLHIESFAKLLK
tara:strand:- start:68 stop:442 length:375 start_codon:yes stop_codon:yes gene_type:complete